MRRWWMLVAACLVLAVAAPLGWWLTRPSSAEGVAVTSVGAPSPSASSPSAPASPSASSARPAVPQVTARPATPADGSRPTTNPVSISIPGIDVRAAVDPVGVEKDGSMVIPRSVDRVGWYRYGPPPGSDAGAAVVAGHVDSKAQGPGALFRLREVGVGDRVDVRLADGRTVRYEVVGKETLVKKRLPTERLFARDGAPRLVLITCGGPFVPELSSYRDNLVVVAEPVGGAA
ncbi:class F sortase [Kineosporia sp. R_H_3]|uniref:class F sortase n=1 Tax=Kineosporia sp. R_H_3 TaxID=1961848 RepID=UPI000B4B0773|nr:class F sortase [Kineosporia sp. R_H_3]